MAQERKRVRILVASPSDVESERKIVTDEIEKWNIVNSDVHGIDLEAIRWETHAHLDSGDRPQELLNQQIVDQCDFAIAMFHARIGTDTGSAPGGAVEEVRRMLQQGKQVMFFFCGMPFPNDADLSQVQAVRNFKDEMQSKALCDSYKDQSEFRQKVTYQLALYLSRKYGISASTGVTGQSSNETYKALVSYQDYLKREFGTMSISGSPAIASFSVALSDTFVSLRLSDTWRSEGRFHRTTPDGVIPDGNRVLTPEEVMSFVFKNHRLLLVIGDPGSGKTTLLKYFALSCLEGRHETLGFTSPVPVFWLPLRELKRAERGYGSLPTNLADWCGRNYLDEIRREHCEAWLEASQTLILLDGLDEISDVDDRIEMCRWIDGMVNKYGNARFVVTSRSTGYRKVDGIEIVTQHTRADIMDFDDEQQSLFLHRWFRATLLSELPPSEEDVKSWRKAQEHKADDKAEAITAYLSEECNRSMKSMAVIPLLLQIMALLWKEHEYLPDSRMKLYDSVLNYLLDYRDRKRTMKPLLSADDARRVLGPVSLWMQEDVKKDEVNRDVMHSKMDEVLRTLNKAVSAKDFCRNLVDRAGVLVEYGDAEYLFRHKTFREYLAAVQLEKCLHRNADFLDELVSHFGDDWWSEVFRFFIDLLDDADLFEQFMLRLFDSPVTESLTPKQQELLLTLVREAPQKQYGELVKRLHDQATTPKRKRFLAECLRTIGKDDATEAVRQFESRRGRGRFINALEFDAHYIPIKGGSIIYSVTQDAVKLPDFRLARYPVTNRQYRRFIAYLKTGRLDGQELMPLNKFRKELVRFAETTKLQWLLNKAQGNHDLAVEFRSRSEDDKRFNGENHPVVSINWYAARSYCLWLSLMESEGNCNDLYRLPDETEWEYATAGKRGSIYPWGNTEPTSKYANYNNNEGATTMVGSYPEGVTTGGLYDMAGNVWEWQENWYDNDKDVRALRGCSWLNSSVYLYCSSRSGSSPGSAVSSVGFRVLRPNLVVEQ
ncbi:MAG: SUMF1/EgtB/PvdO family nonheme iron enzyme [Chlorobiaceae bacterium]|nr:SUMF1/EgtB/PvdO family nonheme iron enzyme [Chlorobiaceae bacterium]